MKIQFNVLPMFLKKYLRFHLIFKWKYLLYSMKHQMWSVLCSYSLRVANLTDRYTDWLNVYL